MRFITRLHSYSHVILTAATLAFACLPLTLAHAQSSTANTYYVSPNGRDSDSGSQAYPFATITHADSVVRPGDTVIVLDGTYSGDIRLSTSGTPGNPITYKAQNKWKAKLVGTGTGDGSAIIGLTGGYVIIQDFDVTGSDANGIILAISGTTASYNQANSNYVHDIVTPCTSNSGTAIETGGGDNYSGITHNDMIGNLVVNISPYNGCPGGHAASGLYAQIPYSVIANNVVINAGYGIQSWHAASHLTIFGNTLVNNLRPITVGDGDSPGGVLNDYSVVQNNIIYNSTNTAIAETSGGTSGTGPHNQYIDNLIYGGNTSISLNNGLVAKGTIYSDPQFVNNTGTAFGDFHVQSSSPARGAGLSLAGIASDFLGTPRPQAGATDIGACLFASSASAPSTPSTPTVTINASPTSLPSGGGTTTVSWNTTNATSANLNGASVAVNSSMTVNPTTTTTYTLTATSASGATVSNAITVTVATSGSVAAGIVASSASIVSGNSSTLTWTSRNAVKGDLNGTAVPVNGTLTVHPTTTTTYRFTATDASGATDWGQVTVTVTAPPAGPVAAGASASPSSITRGQSSVITWTTRNAVKASLNGTSVALNGSITVQPTATTIYKIVATDSTGKTDWGSATVTVR